MVRMIYTAAVDKIKVPMTQTLSNTDIGSMPDQKE